MTGAVLALAAWSSAGSEPLGRVLRVVLSARGCRGCRGRVVRFALPVGWSGGEPLKESGELCAFIGVERCTQLVFVLAGRVDHLLQQLFASGGEVQGVGATVRGAWSAFDELALFELVDEHDDAAARESEVVGERLLGKPVGGADVAQRAGVVRFQAEGC